MAATLVLVGSLATVTHSLATVSEWRTVTFYDVLPEDCRAKVAENDVGNAPGDIYFNTKDKYLPIACAKCRAKGPRGCYTPSLFDCTNPESTGNLVVRELTVEVNGAFGNGYELCDVWPGSAQCQYQCFAPRSHGQKTPGVGMEAVCGGRQPSGERCDMAPEPSFFRNEAWDYWNYNTAARLGNTGQGEWYSLRAKDEGTYWRNATISKAINQRCQARGYDAAVETHGASCFEACPQPKNQSSSCWVHCFFDTVLGPESASRRKPPGKQDGAMAVADLSAAWLRGFASEASGGCPRCPPTGPCPDPTPESDDARAGIAPARVAPRAYAAISTAPLVEAR